MSYPDTVAAVSVVAIEMDSTLFRTYPDTVAAVPVVGAKCPNPNCSRHSARVVEPRERNIAQRLHGVPRGALAVRIDDHPQNGVVAAPVAHAPALHPRGQGEPANRSRNMTSSELFLRTKTQAVQCSTPTMTVHL